MDQNKVVEAFMLYYRTQDESYEWAHQEVEKSILSPSSLELILDLIHACENDEEIAYIAAGPLEELIDRHYTTIQLPLDELVRKDPQMRKAITGVWLSEGSPARKMLDGILTKYGLIYSSL